MRLLKAMAICALLCGLSGIGCKEPEPIPPRPDLSLEDPAGAPVGPPAWFKPENEYSPWPLGDEPKYGTEEWRQWCEVRYHSRDLVREATQAPVIDGVLTEPIWQQAALKQSFTDEGGKTANPGTQISIAYDQKNLYVAGRMTEPQTGKLRALPRERDLPMAEDDHVEIDLAPTWAKTRPAVYRVLVNSAGALSDALGSDSDWSPDIKAKTKVGKNEWSFEMAIPLSALGITPDVELWGKVWACRALRWRFTEGRRELSSWTRLIDPNAGISHWGHLMFKGPKPEPKKTGTTEATKDKE